MDKKTANTVKYVISGLLAVVLVWFAFRGVDWKAFWQGVQQTRWIWVALYFVAAILALVFREERWIALMRPLDPDLRRLGVGQLRGFVVYLKQLVDGFPDLFQLFFFIRHIQINL